MLTDFLIFWQWWLEAIETTRFFHWPFTFVLKCISKSILIKLGHPKKYLPKFPTQKNPGIENFKPPKHPWIITVTWNSEYQLRIERQDIREGNICQWSKTNWLLWSRHSLERTMQAKRITRLTLLIPEWESWRHTEIQCTRKCISSFLYLWKSSPLIPTSKTPTRLRDRGSQHSTWPWNNENIFSVSY